MRRGRGGTPQVFVEHLRHLLSRATSIHIVRPTSIDLQESERTRKKKKRRERVSTASRIQVSTREGRVGRRSLPRASTKVSTCICRQCGESNGISPVKISAATTANDHTSDNSQSVLPLSTRISGADQLIFLSQSQERGRSRGKGEKRREERYFGIFPRSIAVIPLKGRASPRSESLTMNSLVTRKLSDLMSQCMSPLECRKATPAAQSRIIRMRRSMGRQ
jgi:hypothetical protein